MRGRELEEDEEEDETCSTVLLRDLHKEDLLFIIHPNCKHLCIFLLLLSSYSVSSSSSDSPSTSTSPVLSLPFCFLCLRFLSLKTVAIMPIHIRELQEKRESFSFCLSFCPLFFTFCHFLLCFFSFFVQLFVITLFCSVLHINGSLSFSHLFSLYIHTYISLYAFSYVHP